LPSINKIKNPQGSLVGFAFAFDYLLTSPLRILCIGFSECEGEREEGRGKREEGRGKREEGRGKREEGREKIEDRREGGGRVKGHVRRENSLCLGYPSLCATTRLVDQPKNTEADLVVGLDLVFLSCDSLFVARTCDNVGSLHHLFLACNVMAP
jgi:hypothetical protein